MTTATAARVPDRASTSAKGCAAGSGSLTGACSPASSRPDATTRCSSGCCTSKPPAWSSSQQGAGARAGCRSPHAGAPITSSPAAPPVRRAGSRSCSRSPGGTPRGRGGVRRARRARQRRGATSTRSARPGSCGSTSTEPGRAARHCGRSSPSGRATCSIESSVSGACARLLEARPSRCRRHV